MSRPCLVRVFWASFDTAVSAAIRKVSRASRTVTSAPRRAHTEPSSRPITPAPITPRRFGTAWNSRAPVESTMTFWSTGAGGMSIGREPEARITFSASMTSVVPSALVTSTFLPASSLPWPWIEVTPLALNRVATPPVRFLTMPALRPTIAATSIFTSPVEIPWTLKLSLASLYFQELSSSALEGMQPTFRQVPPRASLPSASVYFSIQAVFRPSWAALMAAT